MHREMNTTTDSRFVNVRTFAALDMVHKPKLILVEFTLTVIICASIGVAFFVRVPVHSLLMNILGAYFVALALNYVPLLLYALSLLGHLEWVKEIDRASYARRYMLQSVVLLLVPLVLPLLAIWQEWRRRGAGR